MKHLNNVFLALVLLFSSFNLCLLQAQSNPVVERVADAGLINFNGKYYLAGVFTNGGFYVSGDLVKWEGPVQFFQ